MTASGKPIVWMGDSLERLREFPEEVRDEIGYALYLAQTGRKHMNAKPLHGLGPGVMEIASEHPRGAFRAMYIASLGDRVYVLHAFQKKSRKGIATPKGAIELLRARLRSARELARGWEG